MSLFSWKESFSIGVPEIDKQHKKLYSLADELLSAMNAGKSKDVMAKVLQELVAYTKTHFADEEKLMRRCGYPDVQPHKALHDELTAKVVALQHDLQAGKLMLSMEVMRFLSSWLQQHIGGTDRKYVPYVAKSAMASQAS